MPQSSAQRKLARGVEQVKTLSGETLAFENRNAYLFRVEKEPRTAQEVVYRCFATEREAPPEHWPLLAGEAIHNLRSALDHLVWRAWRDAGNSGLGDHTKFPIAINKHGFKSQSGECLKGVPKPIWTLIEEAQPYRVTPQAPAQDALERLRTLSNIDKHRALATVASSVHHEFVGLPHGVSVKWSEYGTNKTLGPGETYISTFTAHSAPEVEEMNVQPGFTYEVRIEGVPLDTLKWIARRVFQVLVTIETGQPPSPLAAYPI